MGDLPSRSALGIALRSHLERYPFIFGDIQAANNSVQRPSRVSKSLNVSPNYATHFNSGIRELVQNWHDQCKVAAGINGVLQVHDLTPPAVAAMGDLLLAATIGGRSCGYLALSFIPEVADSCDVRLCNYGSTVSMAAMTLGESSKRDQHSLAGYFGEGVKVEINRITAAGAKVTYYTSNQEWTFRYEQEMGSQVLHLHSDRVSDQPSGNTLVLVQGAKRAWFQRQNYLFLASKAYVRYGGGSITSKLELLSEAGHAGRLYVHGFFVSKEEDLPLYGLNFVGGSSSLLSMGFGRDRNRVAVDSLVELVPKLFLELKEDAVKQQQLARLLYVVLDKHPSSAWRRLQYCYGEAYTAMADAMYAVLWREVQSQHAIPVTATESSTDYEYLGMMPRKVSDPLCSVLRSSTFHPTLDQLWERHYHRLLAIPDYVWRANDEADRYRYALIHTLAATFSKYLNARNVRVKALPAGNRNIIVAVQHSSPDDKRAAAAEAAVFVIDVTALSQGEVHKRLKQSDPFFECDYRHCGACACLPIALEDAAIAAIAKVHSVSEYRLRAELRRAQHRHHGLGWKGEMPAPPEPPPVPASGGHPQPMSYSTQDPSASTRHEQTGTTKAGPDRSKQPSRDASAAAPASTTDPHAAPPADPRAQLLDDSLLAKGVRESLDPAEAHQGHKTRHERPTRGHTAAAAPPVPARDCRDSRGALVQSPVSVGHGACLFLREDMAAASLSHEQVQCCRSLYALLNGIHSNVFLQGQTSKAVFYLYYDPSDNTFAFNLGRHGEAGECWYNAAYDPPQEETVGRAKLWFLTACHELAHNFVRCHDSAFADVMGQIVLRYAGRFRDMYPAA